MSYDIRLTEPSTGATIDLPFEHCMTGGTYKASYFDGNFEPLPDREAWLNITYNYSSYYYEATENDPRFAHDVISAYYADGTIGPVVTEYGIRGIYGKTGAESIPMLQDMISRIEEKYRPNGEWISSMKMTYDPKTCEENGEKEISEGNTSDYWMDTAANALKPLYQLLTMAKLRPDGVWEGD